MAVFLVNSRLGLLSAAHCHFCREPHFSRSYVRILPSSLTRGRSRASDYSSFLPVSVSGTVPAGLALDSISRRHESPRFLPPWGASPLARLGPRISLRPSAPRAPDGNYRSPAGVLLTRPAIETCGSCGLFTAFPSAAPFGLALGAALPRADCPSPGNLRFSADGGPTRLSVTCACILSSAPSGAPRGHPFSGLRNAPLPISARAVDPAASVRRLAPLHCLRGDARPVSCYALFQGMAASEPTSWLSAHPHIISHSAPLWDLGRRSGLFPSRRRTLSHAVSLPCAGRRHSQFDRAS